MRVRSIAMFVVCAVWAHADFDGVIQSMDTATSLKIAHDGRTSTVFLNELVANPFIDSAARVIAREKLVNRKVKVIEKRETSRGLIYADVLLESGKSVSDELIELGIAHNGINRDSHLLFDPLTADCPNCTGVS